ncbi:MAG: putative DNA-3-methyladenine glycosylase [Pseudonocardiales bacterium]|nr:putative DNA-3-methyladenine glycosylase [Pseudonocardiales bacterium]
MITSRIALDRPYPVAFVLRWLSAHAVPGMEQCDPSTRRHRRAIRAASGPGVIEVDFSDPRTLELTMELASPADAPGVEAAVRRWLDIDAPVTAIEAHLMRFPLLAPMVAARPGLRALGALDGFEAAVMTVLGQHVSVAAARTFGGRLVAEYGAAGRGGLRMFPGPDPLAAAGPADLQAAVGVTHARARTLQSLCASVASGALVLDASADPVAARAALLALPGVGPWTADYLALRVYRDADAFPADDLVIKRALGVARPKDAIALAEPWSPYRAYAVIHLWTSMALS